MARAIDLFFPLLVSGKEKTSEFVELRMNCKIVNPSDI